MASSRDKAISLKDNYVAGLIEGGATAPIQGMKEQDMGEQASVYYNLDRNTSTLTNDGDPAVYVKNAGRIYKDTGEVRNSLSVSSGRPTAYPLSAPSAYTYTGNITPREAYEVQNLLQGGYFR